MRGLLVDITFQKELERQVIESQKMEALGRLAGGVAHDFNNIITGISGYAHLIRAKPHHGEAVADSSEKILTGCDRATDLVRHFLATAGRRHPDKQRVRVGQLVSEIFKLLQPTYGLNITCHNTIDGQNDAVWAEPAQVFQVLMNLCVNGAQAISDKGGGDGGSDGRCRCRPGFVQRAAPTGVFHLRHRAGNRARSQGAHL